ncbi:unnamed protein product [Gemmata massiliana]|uniref:Uncharacterized protein n=1 Tax=Gemmata massiliana TaxID=1210884 RepID=A0A6P2CU61_9BACT|nr:hypothetical protein [Gemmata massiliana]VTR92521.1 unnamed protein product [Gemmata massiliana]
MAVKVPRLGMRIAHRALSRTKFNADLLAILGALENLEVILSDFTQHNEESVTAELATMGVRPEDYSASEFSDILEDVNYCSWCASGFMWAVDSFKATADSLSIEQHDYGVPDDTDAAPPHIATAQKESTRG